MVRADERLARSAFAMLVAGATTLGTAACSSRTLPYSGQLVLYVNTDAPLPPAPGDVLGPTDPFPLFDRMRIEIFLPGQTQACGGCTRDFDIDRTLVGAGQASIGVVPAVGADGYTARVRMFRGAVLEDGQPDPDSTLDTTVALPAIASEGITEATIVLSTDDVAVPQGQGAPVTPDPGPPAPGLVGTWPGAQVVPCNGSPAANEACIPGGAYWMGNPLVQGEPYNGGDNTRIQRLVTVSPFFTRTTEVTVAEFRAAKLKATPTPNDPINDPMCTYTAAPSAKYDPLPVTCVVWQDARSYCQAMGGDLPSEAQFEYMASALESDLYVWGNDEPACGDAVFARMTNEECPPAALPTKPGTGARDRLSLAGNGAPVVDLAGNVQEWALDVYNAEGPPCWGVGVFQDPVCTAKSSDPTTVGWRSIRGGAFVLVPASMRAASRDANPANVYRTIMGFRCVRPAT
jgi:formylglycine-generating enzyme required for sulfatase activity